MNTRVYNKITGNFICFDSGSLNLKKQFYNKLPDESPVTTHQ